MPIRPTGSPNWSAPTRCAGRCETNAVGLLHEEMRRSGSLILAAADVHKLPAGGALAVDRDLFAATVTERLEAEPWSGSNAARSRACRPKIGKMSSSRPAP